MKRMQKILIWLLGLIILDFAIIWAALNFWQPVPEEGLILIPLAPMLLGFNLLIAYEIYYGKDKTEPFFAYTLNGFVSSGLLVYLFSIVAEPMYYQQNDVWEFQESDTLYHIIKEKAGDNAYLVNQSRYQVDSGTVKGSMDEIGGDWIFYLDTNELKVIDGRLLIGFRDPYDTIPIIRID